MHKLITCPDAYTLLLFCDSKTLVFNFLNVVHDQLTARSEIAKQLGADPSQAVFLADALIDSKSSHAKVKMPFFARDFLDFFLTED